MVRMIESRQLIMSLPSCLSKTAIFHDFLSEKSGEWCAQITCLPYNTYTNRRIGDTLWDNISNILSKLYSLWRYSTLKLLHPCISTIHACTVDLQWHACTHQCSTTTLLLLAYPLYTTTTILSYHLLSPMSITYHIVMVCHANVPQLITLCGELA